MKELRNPNLSTVYSITLKKEINPEEYSEPFQNISDGAFSPK